MTVLKVDHHGGDAVPHIERDDFVVTERLVYRVLDSRPVESRLWHDRWRVELTRICTRKEWENPANNDAYRVPPGRRVHHVSRYAEGEQPTDHRCGFTTCACAGGSPQAVDGPVGDATLGGDARPHT